MMKMRNSPQPYIIIHNSTYVYIEISTICAYIRLTYAYIRRFPKRNKKVNSLLRDRKHLKDEKQRMSRSNRIAFFGQPLTIWLARPEDRARLENVIREKYRGSIGYSAYGRLAISKLLDQDEEELGSKKLKGKGQGLPKKVTSPQGEHTRPHQHIESDPQIHATHQHHHSDRRSDGYT